MPVSGGGVWVVFAVDLVFIAFLLFLAANERLGAGGRLTLMFAVVGLVITFNAGIHHGAVCISRYNVDCHLTPTSTTDPGYTPVAP